MLFISFFLQFFLSSSALMNMIKLKNKQNLTKVILLYINYFIVILRVRFKEFKFEKQLKYGLR
jgi:hypothetical protein